jgi:CO/xanthine dehydrogenase Mo-binding subunit
VVALSSALIGRRMARVEDGPLLRGQGRFVDDLSVSDACMWRSCAAPLRMGG